MHNLKHNPIGIYEKAIPNAFDWETKIKVAKEAGFNFLEISIDESDERLARLDWAKEDRFFLRNLLHENDFHIRSMCLSGHRRYPFGSKNPDIQKKAYEIMEKAIQFAADLGIRNIQLAGYDVYYEEADEDTKKILLVDSYLQLIKQLKQMLCYQSKSWTQHLLEPFQNVWNILMRLIPLG